MLHWVKGRINCLRGRHERSAKRARRVDGRYESVCSYCGVPMVRLSKRNWILKRDAGGRGQ